MPKSGTFADQLTQDQHWMQKALTLAERAGAQGEVPVGAVLVRDGAIIGEGWNCPIASNDPCAHAEIIALREAAKHVNNYRLVDTTLYVTIEPCTMCAGAMVHARIARLVYAATESKSGVIESNGCIFEQAFLNHKVAFTGGVLAEQSSRLISEFFRRRRLEKKLPQATNTTR